MKNFWEMAYGKTKSTHPAYLGYAHPASSAISVFRNQLSARRRNIIAHCFSLCHINVMGSENIFKARNPVLLTALKRLSRNRIVGNDIDLTVCGLFDIGRKLASDLVGIIDTADYALFIGNMMSPIS